MTAKSTLAKLVVNLVLLAGAVCFLFPLVWMVSTSVKPASETTELPPRLFPYPEKKKAQDGRLYPAAFYRPTPRDEEKLVALLERSGGSRRIEIDVEGGKQEVRVVPAAQVRVPPTWRWENY